MALLQTLQDPFNQSTLNATLWSSFSDGTATLSYSSTGGQINYPGTSSSATNAGVESQSTYNLTGSYAYIHILNTLSGTGSDTNFGVLAPDTSNQYLWQLEAGTLYALRVKTGTVTQVGSLTFNATTHAWWRISNLSGTTISWDTSTDGVTWTSRFTFTNNLTITAATLDISVASFAADTGAGTFKWNNVSTPGGSITTKTQSAISRISKTVTKTQSAVANITTGQRVKTQSSTARIQRRLTKTQTATANIIQNTFTWKGILWQRRTDTGDPMYNGQWNPANVLPPDGNDYVTLRITNPSGSSPYAAEFYSVQQGWGYGTYTLVVGTPLQALPKSVVFGGMFTYSDNPADGVTNLEIDMDETSAWGGGPDQNWDVITEHNYFINSGGVKTSVANGVAPSATGYLATTDPVVTHVMTWSSTKIIWDSYVGTGTGGTLLLHTEQTTQVPVPGSEVIDMNLWVFGGNDGLPDVTPQTDVVLRDFTFVGANTKQQTAKARIATNLTKTQPGKARISQKYTKTQTATANIIVNHTKTQTATARVLGRTAKIQTSTARIAVKLTNTQSAVARITTTPAHTKTQTAIARIRQNRTKTQTATARIGGPPQIMKTYLYKVYRDGVFLGCLPNVISEFGFGQDINTAGSQITVKCAVSPDTTSLSETTTIDDESGTPIQDENGISILSEGAIGVVGFGADTTIIKNGNKVQVWEYSKWHPNGVCVMLGEMDRWEAPFGGDGQDEVISILVYSDGQDLGNYMLIGSPFVPDVSQTTQDSNIGIFADGASYQRVGQSITTGAAVTNIGALDIYCQGTGGVTLNVWPDVASANAGTGLLGTTTQAVNNVAAGVSKIAFATPITVVPSTSYFYTLESSVPSSAAILIYFKQADVYAPGIMSIDYFDGLTTPTGYLNTPIGSITSSSDIYFETYTNAGETVSVFTGEDPSADMLTETIDKYNDQGGQITYTPSSIDPTTLSLTYQFNTSTVLSGVGTFLSLSPDGFFWFVELGTNVLWFKNASTSPDFYITKGREIDKVTIIATIENVKNVDYFSGGLLGSGSNLFSVYDDPTSKSRYGQRLNISSDNRVVLQDTADAIGQSFIAENKDEQFQTTVTLLDSMIDISALRVGMIAGFRGFGGFVDGLASQIVHIEYTPEEATLTLGILPPRVTISLAEITRNLLAQQTIDNPSSPS